jgi:hypothetical protein
VTLEAETVFEPASAASDGTQGGRSRVRLLEREERRVGAEVQIDAALAVAGDHRLQD